MPYIFSDQNFNNALTNDTVSFQQLGPDNPPFWSCGICMHLALLQKVFR